MRGFIVDIEKETLENENFRKVLYTAENSQLVVMTIPVGGEIGMETHHLDQFIRIEQGEAEVFLDDDKGEAEADFAIVIPAGTKHNVVNTGQTELKLYSVYSPPEHKHGTIHKTKEEAMENEEHFDGVTSI